MAQAYAIMFYRNGKFQHGIIDTDKAEIDRHFELLKVTRSGEKLPEMRKIQVDTDRILEIHIKDPTDDVRRPARR